MGSYCERLVLARLDSVSVGNSENLAHEHKLRFGTSARHSGLMV